MCASIALTDLSQKEDLEKLLQPEILKVTGYHLILQSHPTASKPVVRFFSDNSKVVLYVPESFHFSAPELKNMVLTAYTNLITHSNNLASDIEKAHKIFNHKN